MSAGVTPHPGPPAASEGTRGQRGSASTGVASAFFPNQLPFASETKFRCIPRGREFSLPLGGLDSASDNDCLLMKENRQTLQDLVKIWGA